MRKFLILFTTMCLLTGCHKDFKREEPVRVIVRDLIKKTNEYIIERRMYYALDSVVIDTIQRSNNSTLHIPSAKINNIPDDVVDLNEILSSGADDPTDYNYTELNEEEWKYLDSLGVYWDDELGYWRKCK